MAQFEPGHLHIEREALTKDDYSYDYCVDYKAVQDPGKGKSVIENIAHKHGIPVKGIVTSVHKTHYDRMFEDIREKLGAKSGDSINPESLG